MVTTAPPVVRPVVVSPEASITRPPASAILTTVPALSEGSGLVVGKLWSSGIATKPPRESRRFVTKEFTALEVAI